MRLNQPAVATGHLPGHAAAQGGMTRSWWCRARIQTVALRPVERRSAQRSPGRMLEWRGARRANGGSLTAWSSIDRTGKSLGNVPAEEYRPRKSLGSVDCRPKRGGRSLCLRGAASTDDVCDLFVRQVAGWSRLCQSCATATVNSVVSSWCFMGQSACIMTKGHLMPKRSIL